MKTLLTFIFIFVALFASAQNTDTTRAVKDTAKAVSPVEVPPDFKGGQAKFNQFLNKNIVYPKQARKDHIEGRVILTFVVEKDGTLTGLRILRGVSPEIDQEVLRVMGISPPWTPGTQNGKPVRVQFSIPIGFRQS